MKSQRGFTLFELIFAVASVAFVAGAIGWVWNIVKIVQQIDVAVTGMFILRCIGVVVAPLGAVLGYM